MPDDTTSPDSLVLRVLQEMRAELAELRRGQDKLVASFQDQRDEHNVSVGLAIRASGQQTVVDALVRRVERLEREVAGLKAPD